MDKITYEQYEQIQDEMIIDFLKNVSSKERHQLALGLNWDSNLSVLKWIVNDSATDKATALLIYWKSAPRWRKRYAGRDEVLSECAWEIGEFDLVEETEKLFLSEFYRNHQFSFDPANDRGIDWTAEYLDQPVKLEIPSVMFEKLNGENVEYTESGDTKDWEEGIPPHICKKMREYEVVG